MKYRLRVNEWECIHLKPQDLLRDAYWINRAWILDLEWSTQAGVCRDLSHLPSNHLHSGWVAAFLSTSSNHNPGEQQELWVCLRVCVVVCLCVLCLCLGLCARNESIIGIAFHSSITFLSGRIPQSPKMYLLYVYFVCEASVWLGCQVSLTPWLSFGERCAMCLTALALLDSSCLWMQLQSLPRWMFLSTRSGTIH